MNNIKLTFGPNSYRDADPKMPKIDFSAEFGNEAEALDFMNKLNILVQNFIAHKETFGVGEFIESMKNE